jgi:hypothetical protein
MRGEKKEESDKDAHDYLDSKPAITAHAQTMPQAKENKYQRLE